MVDCRRWVYHATCQHADLILTAYLVGVLLFVHDTCRTETDTVVSSVYNCLGHLQKEMGRAGEDATVLQRTRWGSLGFALFFGGMGVGRYRAVMQWPMVMNSPTYSAPSSGIHCISSSLHVRCQDAKLAEDRPRLVKRSNSLRPLYIERKRVGLPVPTVLLDVSAFTVTLNTKEESQRFWSLEALKAAHVALICFDIAIVGFRATSFCVACVTAGLCAISRGLTRQWGIWKCSRSCRIWISAWQPWRTRLYD